MPSFTRVRRTGGADRDRGLTIGIPVEIVS